MKSIFKTLALVAVAVTTLVACQNDIDKNQQATSIVKTFKFYAQTADAKTKATLTPNEDETTFVAAWEGTDAMALDTYGTGVVNDQPVEFSAVGTASWDDNDQSFEATYDPGVTVPAEQYTQWTYKAFYPWNELSFGSERTQDGNKFNSEYDLMYGTLQTANCEVGKNADGSPIVIPMNRLTAIAYYHIQDANAPKEDVVSATLTVDSNKVIAAESIVISNDGTSITPTDGTNTITITFDEGTAPEATDFQLWFNLLTETIGEASAYNVTVDIETTGHTARLTSKSARSFTAGKLNRAKISSLTWTPKPPKVYTKVTSEPSDWSGTYLIVFEGTTVNNVEVPPVAFDGSLNILDAANNGTAISISGNSITGNSTIDAAVFEISAVTEGYSIQAVSNNSFIGNGSNTNALTASETALLNTLSLNEDYSVDIVSSGGAYLRYNANSGNYRFRYFKSSSYANQKSVYLYRLDNRKGVSLSFDPDEPEAIILGDEFTEPALAVVPVAAQSSVTYSVSTDPVNCATINSSTGELTITAACEITVTASIPDNDDTYSPSSASYSLTVNPVPAIVHGTVDNPVALEDVATAINALNNNEVTDDFYYVGGTVSVASTGIWSGKLTFTFGDDTYDIKAYNCLGIGGTAFSSKDDIAIGDEVVVYGKLEKFVQNSTTTYEIVECELAKYEKAPYFTASAIPLTVESTGGNCTLTINANVPWMATIDNGATLKIGDATPNASVSGSEDTEVSVIIPENTNGATYTISFSTTSNSVSVPEDIEIVQNAYIDMTVATATFTSAASGGMATASNSSTSGTRRNVTAAISAGGNNATYGCIQVYKSATLTISVPTGAFITNVEFKGTSDNPVSGFGNITGLTTTGDDGSWSNSNGLESVTFTASNKQVRLTEITVTYKIAAEALVNYVPIITAEDMALNVGESTPVGATSDSDGAITYEIVSGSDFISLASGTVTANEVGTAVIRVNVAADGNFDAGYKDINVVVSEPVLLDKLTATGWPQDYTVGSSFSFGSGTVTAHYTDGSTKNLTMNDVEVLDFDSSEETTGQTVTISYTEDDITKEVEVTVNIVSGGDEYTDVLNQSWTNISGTNYSTWTAKPGSASDAIYAGNCAGDKSSIQLRSNNSNSGIVSTTSGGKVKKVVVTWHNDTQTGRTLNIYGKNSAYSQATDLYSTNTRGTLLGTIVCGTSTELTITGDYSFIGFRSNSGAMYLTEVDITWEN